MKKFKGIIILNIFIVLLIVSGCGSGEKKTDVKVSENGEEQHNIVLSHTAVPGLPMHLTYSKFKEEVEERTGGSVTVTIHDSASLAADVEGVEMLKNDTLDIASAGTNNMGSFTDLFFIFDLPYMFKDVEATHKVINSEIGDEIKGKAEEELGLKLLFFVDPGTQRDVMNVEKEIRVPSDMKGLRFRSTETPVEMKYLESLGAVATPITWVETYSSLEQGVVKGLTNQLHHIITGNLHEVLNYATETGGIHSLHLALMNMDTFNELSESQQEAVLEAAQVAQDYNFAEAPNFADDLKQQMIDKGVEFYTPTPEEKELWIQESVKVWDEFTDKIDQDLVERIQEMQED